MKFLFALTVLGFLVAGCSERAKDHPPVIAADLGKDTNYFSNLHGPATSVKNAGDYTFSLPGASHDISATGPFVVQQYASGRLSVTVIFPSQPGPAIWVKYSLLDPWTPEQINAALSAYSSHWETENLNQGLSAVGQLVMQSMMAQVSPVAYQSDSGMLAYKTLGNILMVYSPPLYQTLKQNAVTAEQKAKEVPKF